MAKELRVLTILEAYSITGPAKAVLEFASECMRPGSEPRVELSIAAFARGNEENAFTLAVRRKEIPLDIVHETGAFDFSIIRQLRDIVDRRRPDIIWTNAVKSHFLIRASGLHHRARWVAFHHGYTTTSWKTRLYNQLDRWSHNGPERIVTVCDKFARDLASRGVDRGRIYVEHMPIRPAAVPSPAAIAELHRSQSIPEGCFVLLTVGRLSREKAQADLLNAVALVRKSRPAIPFHLLIAGDGPESEALRTLTRTLELADIVHFAGHQENVRPFYSLADAFVLSSHTEGSPNVLLEAMDAGIPVVATAVGGVPELATDNETALLVPSGDIPAMAGAIIRILDEGPLRKRLVLAARGVVAQHTPERYFESIVSVLQEVAS